LHIPSAFLDTLKTEGIVRAKGKRKKPKRFTAVEAVKAMARAQIGMPPTARVVPDRKKKTTEKHKPPLEKLLNEAE
jgi:DNA topoisomerase IA